MPATILGTAALAAGLTFLGQAVAAAVQAVQREGTALRGAIWRAMNLAMAAVVMLALFLILVPGT